MASIWYKILCAIQNVNLVIQARDSTIDIEADNIEASLRDRWEDVYHEASVVAENVDITEHHRLVGIRKAMGEITSDTYCTNVFYKSVDSVLAGLGTRYRAIHDINSTFKFL